MDPAFSDHLLEEGCCNAAVKHCQRQKGNPRLPAPAWKCGCDFQAGFRGMRLQVTESQIQCLKDNLDKIVELETVEGEKLVAKILAIFHDPEYDEHDFLLRGRYYQYARGV